MFQLHEASGHKPLSALSFFLLTVSTQCFITCARRCAVNACGSCKLGHVLSHHAFTASNGLSTCLRCTWLNELNKASHVILAAKTEDNQYVYPYLALVWGQWGGGPAVEINNTMVKSLIVAVWMSAFLKCAH